MKRKLDLLAGLEMKSEMNAKLYFSKFSDAFTYVVLTRTLFLLKKITEARVHTKQKSKQAKKSKSLFGPALTRVPNFPSSIKIRPRRKSMLLMLK